MRYAIILLALLSASCSSTIPSLKPYRMDIQQGNVVNSKMMSQLRPGMTKSQVRFILGTPLIQDSFHSNRWDYFYQMRKGGAIIEQRRVILDFENDLLKGVRGDVIPASTSEDKSETPATGSDALSKSEAKPEEKKGLTDKLKFWDKDAKPAEKAQPKANNEAKLSVPAALVEGAAATEAAVPVAEVAAATVAAEATPQSAAIDSPAVLPEPAVVAESASPSAVLPAVSDLKNPEVVTARVNAWADAWRNKDVAAYLQFYSDKFVPDSLPSKKAWVAQRKQRLAKPGKIDLVLDEVKVSVDGETATAEFTQKYSAQGFSDNVNKVLKLNLEHTKSNGENNWFIVKESAIAEATLPPVSAAAAAVIQQKMASQKMPADSVSPSEDAKVPDDEAVAAQVTAWAAAWRKKEVDKYLSFYADKFSPDGVPSKKAWVAQRKSRLSKPGEISLDLDGIKTSIDGKQAKVTFVQRYSSNGYSDNVSKALLLQRIGSNWLIVKESVVSNLIKIDATDEGVEAKAPKLTPEQKSDAMPEYPVEVPPAPQVAEPALTPEPAPVAATPQVSKPQAVEQKSASAKEAGPEAKVDAGTESKPSLFERMLEKIGF
ncbi:MAG TPA: outer membrane protein assembly factor BamE [Methylophilaceae bacterium]|nr:outer membrane protein assembly factor BamE [Methylophilaceae bacterium]